MVSIQYMYTNENLVSMWPIRQYLHTVSEWGVCHAPLVCFVLRWEGEKNFHHPTHKTKETNYVCVVFAGGALFGHPLFGHPPVTGAAMKVGTDGFGLVAEELVVAVS